MQLVLNVDYEFTGLVFSHEEKFHFKNVLCTGPRCDICTRHKALWADVDAAADFKTREKLMHEARELKPISRFHYTSNEGPLPVGKFVHEEIKEKGPNVKIRKSLMTAGSGRYVLGNEPIFPKYDVERLKITQQVRIE